MEPVHPIGLLLNGGASRRMGSDKARLALAGVPLAVRAARALAAVAYPVLVVGDPADTGLDAVDDPRDGPLVAFATGAAFVRPDRPMLLVASDLPFLVAGLLREVMQALEDGDAAVPVLDGRDQPLCAAYTPRAASVAQELVAGGARAMRDLLAALPSVRRLDAGAWAQSLFDVDTPPAFEEAKRILDAPA